MKFTKLLLVTSLLLLCITVPGWCVPQASLVMFQSGAASLPPLTFQGNTGSGSLTTTASGTGATGPISTIGYSLIIIDVTSSKTNVCTLTDSSSNTWSSITAFIFGSTQVTEYYVFNPVTSGSWTAQCAASSSFASLVGYAFSGTFSGVRDVSGLYGTGTASGSTTMNWVSGDQFKSYLTGKTISANGVTYTATYVSATQLTLSASATFTGASFSWADTNQNGATSLTSTSSLTPTGPGVCTSALGDNSASISGLSMTGSTGTWATPVLSNYSSGTNFGTAGSYIVLLSASAVKPNFSWTTAMGAALIVNCYR